MFAEKTDYILGAEFAKEPPLEIQKNKIRFVPNNSEKIIQT